MDMYENDTFATIFCMNTINFVVDRKQCTYQENVRTFIIKTNHSDLEIIIQVNQRLVVSVNCVDMM